MKSGFKSSRCAGRGADLRRCKGEEAQRASIMALIPSQVLRVAILLSYFSILCHYKALDMPAHQTYGGSWKFLTFIDLVRLQAAFLTASPPPPRREGGSRRSKRAAGLGADRSRCRGPGARRAHTAGCERGAGGGGGSDPVRPRFSTRFCWNRGVTRSKK